MQRAGQLKASHLKNVVQGATLSTPHALGPDNYCWRETLSSIDQTKCLPLTSLNGLVTFSPHVSDSSSLTVETSLLLSNIWYKQVVSTAANSSARLRYKAVFLF